MDMTMIFLLLCYLCFGKFGVVTVFKVLIAFFLQPQIFFTNTYCYFCDDNSFLFQMVKLRVCPLEHVALYRKEVYQPPAMRHLWDLLLSR